MQNLKVYAPSVLRYVMALVILWFGVQQFIDTTSWLGYVPDSIVSLTHLSRETLVHFNGGVELVLGMLLLFGIWTRWVALLLAVHLLDIMITVGYSQIAVRDFGLALATFTVFMNGPDQLSQRKFGIGAAVVALITLIAVTIGNSKSLSTPATATSSVATPAPSAAVTKPEYKDGTYTATGSYMSPGGADKLQVTLTLKSDVVTAVSVKTEPGDNTSAYYQNIFAQNYAPLVVGKDISSIKLSKVSGSSLTPGGFNDALNQIEAQAKA